jgi:hypothetical protein
MDIGKTARRFCLIATTVCFIVSLLALARPLRLVIAGHTAEAIVTDVEAVHDTTLSASRFDRGYRAEYVFHMHNRMVTNRAFVKAGDYQRGDSVSVRYLPASTDVATIDPLLYSFGGTVVFLVGSALFFTIHRVIVRGKRVIW